MMGAFGGIAGYGGGPERSGCGTYCSILDDLSRDLLEEDSKAQLQLQGYQGQALDVMVTTRVTALHNQRVALNRRSWEQHEEPRTPENAIIYEARLDERDGQLHLYHPEAQQFVHDMFANTARVAKRAEREFGITGLYNKQEHQTFLQIEKAVLSGKAAAGMWAAYDASGTVRYVSQIENQGGTIIARWIDVGLIRGDLTPEEGVSLLQRIAGENHGSRLVTSDESALHLIMEQKSLSSDAVWKATNIVIDERSAKPFNTEQFSDGVRTVGYADVRPVLADTAPSRHVLMDVPRLEEIGKNEIVSEIHTRIHPGIAAMGTLKVVEEMHRKKIDNDNSLQRFSLVELIDRHITQGIVQTAEFLAPQAKQPKIADMERRRKREQVEIGSIQTETREGRVEEKHPKEGAGVEKSIRRYKEKEARIMKHEVKKRTKREAKKDSVKVQPLKTERVEPLRTAKERKGRKNRRKVYMGVAAVTRIYTFEKQGKRREEKIGVKKIAVAEKITPMGMLKPEKQERREKKRLRRVIRRAEQMLEAKQVPEKERKLWVALAVAATALASQESVLRGCEQVPIAEIRFAWIVWMMLRTKNESKQTLDPRRSLPRTLMRGGDDRRRRRGAKLIHLAGEQSEQTLRRQEVTSWILLSIIYYLTAIREQAMRSHPISQISPVQQTIPHYAVIYAFAS